MSARKKTSQTAKSAEGQSLATPSCSALRLERFTQPGLGRGFTGPLTGIQVGEIRRLPGKTRKQAEKSIMSRIYRYRETFSWDPNANPIAVRRDA